MFFESVAYAQQTAAPAAQQGGAAASLMSFLPIIIIFVIFYFLLIRPQQKKQKQHMAMLDALKAGDSVVTNAGIIGTIVSVDGNIIVVDLGAGNKVQVIKGYIADKFEPELYKASNNGNNAVSK